MFSTEMKRKYPKNIISIVILSILILVITLPAIIIFWKTEVPNVMFVATTNNIFDKSVNQDIYEGSMQYASDYYDEPEEGFNYIIPSSWTYDGLLETYDTMYRNGADVTINISSSYQGLALQTIFSQFAEEEIEDKYAIVLDDAEWALRDYENIISIYFLANEASFVAGVLGSMYLVSTYDNPDQWVISTWGGLPYDNVVQLMSGFEQGVNWFNYYFLGTDVTGNIVDNTITTVDSLMTAPGEKVRMVNFGRQWIDYSQKPIDATNWFTNSFTTGDAEDEAAILVEQLNANVIFPVAGGQTSDLLSIVSSLKSDTKVIGVDSDARNSYPAYSEYILTSATKNFGLTTYYAIWYAQHKYLEEVESDYLSSEINPFDFIKNYSSDSEESKQGWKIDVNSTDETIGTEMDYGDTFLANFDNGGVGVTQYDEEDSLLDQAWKHLFEASYLNTSAFEIAYSNTNDSLEEFLADSIAYQEYAKIDPNQLSGIENYSNTFYSSKFNVSIEYVASKRTTTNINAPWIPDWEGIYSL